MTLRARDTVCIRVSMGTWDRIAVVHEGNKAMDVVLDTVRELGRRDFAEVDKASMAAPQMIMTYHGFVEVDDIECP